jgi:hypothetical protein
MLVHELAQNPRMAMRMLVASCLLAGASAGTWPTAYVALPDNRG